MNSGSPATELELGKPGSCIGVKGSSLSGTLGGYFDLEFEGKIRKGFLTTYHVLAPLNAHEDVQTRAHDLGSSSDLDDESRCEVVSPSEREIANDISIYNGFVDELVTKKLRLIKIKDMLEDCEESTDWVERFDADIKKIRNHLEFYDAKLTQLGTMPSRIGKVLLSSGRATLDGRISDWAFVELDSDRPSFPNTTPLYRYGYPRERLFYLIDAAKPGAPATGFARIRPGRMYLKEGKESGVTLGVCNGVELYLPKDIGHVYGTEEPLTGESPGSKEFVIIPTGGHTLSFCKPGDSGSLVYDVYGRICGLHYGQLDDKLGMDLGLLHHFRAYCKLLKRREVF